MSNYYEMDAADYADNFYAREDDFACDVCEDDAAYAMAEFANGCPDCGLASDDDALDSWLYEDAALESSLFSD